MNEIVLTACILVPWGFAFWIMGKAKGRMNVAKDLEERLEDALNAGDKGEKKPLFGFATLSKAERSALASKGGKKAQASGRAHRWTSETARAAGKLSRRAVETEVDPAEGVEE